MWPSHLPQNGWWMRSRGNFLTSLTAEYVPRTQSRLSYILTHACAVRTFANIFWGAGTGRPTASHVPCLTTRSSPSWATGRVGCMTIVVTLHNGTVNGSATTKRVRVTTAHEPRSISGYSAVASHAIKYSSSPIRPTYFVPKYRTHTKL